MEKRKKRFHARLLFQHTNRKELQDLTSYVVNFIANNKISSSINNINWSIDVDPKEIF